tara:strand:- start:161 stop:880 length:720 start_codon:yes stop_codon:yes gene_type:complete
MGLSHSPLIVTDGLLICLDAANKKSYPGSGNEWYDLSGNKYHMSLKNSPSFTTFNGAACFDLDGSNDYGSCDGTISGSTSATVSNLGVGGTNEKTVVCVAVIDDSVGSSQGGLFDLGNAGSTGRHYCLRLNSNFARFRAQFWSTPDYDFNYDGRAIWTMYSVVYGSDKIGKTYGNDGVLLGNDGGAYNLATSGSRAFEMGRYNGGSYFGGKVSQYLVYNKALTPEEIQQNYRAIRGRYK